MSKIAVVTGASSGLGREFVVQISEKYKTIDEIWVIARRTERLYALERERRQEGYCSSAGYNKAG